MLNKIAIQALVAASALLASVAWAHMDLNKASEIELDGLKGLGPTMTRHILDERQRTPFRDWPDVMHRIKGIGPKLAFSLSEQGIRVHGQAYEQAVRKASNKP